MHNTIINEEDIIKRISTKDNRYSVTIYKENGLYRVLLIVDNEEKSGKIFDTLEDATSFQNWCKKEYKITSRKYRI